MHIRARFSRTLFALAVLGVSLARPAASQDQATQPPVTVDIDVVAKNLDAARQQIQPSLGASTYNFSPQALETVPQGGAAPLNQVLLQAPGVAQDSLARSICVASMPTSSTG